MILITGANRTPISHLWLQTPHPGLQANLSEGSQIWWKQWVLFCPVVDKHSNIGNAKTVNGIKVNNARSNCINDLQSIHYIIDIMVIFKTKYSRVESLPMWISKGAKNNDKKITNRRRYKSVHMECENHVTGRENQQIPSKKLKENPRANYCDINKCRVY